MVWIVPDDLRGFDPNLANTTKYTDEQLVDVIADAEVIIETILSESYNVRTVTDEWHLGDGGVWLRLRRRPLVSITSASIDGSALAAGTITAMVKDKIGGRVKYTSGWTFEKEILITYTHGNTAPPVDLERAAKRLCRGLLGETRNPIMDRAERYMPDGKGGAYLLSMASAGKTGFPDVDGILERYRIPGMAGG